MQKTQTICLVILATIAVSFSLYYLQSVLLPFVIAVFIVIGCRPILEFVEKRLQLPRFLAFVFSFLVGILLLLGFAFLIWVSVNDLASNSDAYRKRMNAIVTWVVERVPSSSRDDTPTNESGESQAGSDSSVVDSTSNDPSADNNAADNDPSLAIQEFLTWVSSYVQSQMVRLAGSLSSLLSYGILILIFVFFLLLGNSEPGPRDAATTGKHPGILSEIEDQIRKYLLLKTAISLVTGFAFGLVLWMFGVPLAIVFGFLAFLLNFIPNIGPLIASVLPVPFLVLNSNMSPTSAIICFVLISTIQFVSGNVIETRMMGKSFDVSPVTLLLALMFFGLVWGIVGMFLATPIVSIIKIVFQQRESTRPIADLMAGRLDVLDSYQA
jgi:AI-2 transport protein TqsA